MAKTDHAIIIGITRYPGMGDLEGPENDARNFYEYLTVHAADKVPVAQATLIVSSQFPGTGDKAAKPMVDEIDLVLADLSDKAIQQVKFGRRLWLFMAGHGFAPGPRDAALLTANARASKLYHVQGGAYADWFYMAAGFEEVILLMDCCRDQYPRTTPHRPAWDELQRAGENVRTFYAYATKWSRKSRETSLPELFPKPEGSAPKPQIQGLFTNLLIRGLKGEANVGGGDITGKKLKDFVHNNLKIITVDGKSQQAEINGEGLDEIVFVKDAPLRLTKVKIQGVPPNERLEIWKNLDTLVQFRPSGGDFWEVELERGFYKILAPKSGRSHLFEIINEEAIDVEFPK